MALPLARVGGILDHPSSGFAVNREANGDGETKSPGASSALDVELAAPPPSAGCRCFAPSKPRPPAASLLERFQTPSASLEFLFRSTAPRRQRTEDRGQRTEDSGQRTEDSGQRTEDRGQRTQDRGQRTEDRGTQDGGQRTEDTGQRTEDTGRRTEDGPENPFTSSRAPAALWGDEGAAATQLRGREQSESRRRGIVCRSRLSQIAAATWN
ncbi:N-acetyl lactosaminide beta-1,3-N-acetyl glucosaminyl transferase [Marssonina coronariae]|uniref:N-acetyl lactosaminide beta-1,3-N-acetyl glucosaminyl transferase n=1 Tax=Diplocarpon coronariae TaxID=2795749 RepID=A0A218Z7X6_9HELO|nr:N-acetyl lactosaminide beta-1,3-N-acetyl glucosaminyl transferase [Marssonina coronariae]